MSNIFELNERIGFTPPVQFQKNPTNYFFQFGIIRINKLIQNFSKGSFTLQDYHYLTGKIVNISTSDKTLKSYFLNNSKRYPKNFVFLQDQYNIPYKSGLNEYFFETFISNKRGAKISKNNPVFSANINLSNKTFKYRVLFPFDETPSSDLIADKHGVVIQTSSFEAFEVLIEDLGLDITSLKKQVIRSFNILFADAKDDRNKLDEIYEFAPNFVIQSRGRDRLEIDLKNILKGWVDTYGTNEEIAVVNMLTGIFRTSKSADHFLEFLLEDFDKKYTYLNQVYPNIEMIINKIGGEALNNFGILLQIAWRQSNYSNRNNNIYKSVEPVFLPYRSDRTLGFYHDNVDAYLLSTKELRIIHKRSFFDSESYYCPPYLPIGIPVEQKGDIILGNQIPAIMLYIKDSEHFWNNLVTTIDYVVDIVTLVSGYGAYRAFSRLGKIATRASSLKFGVKVARYTRVKGALKLVTGVIEVSSSTIRILLRAANLDKTETGKDISDFLFYFELLALGGDLRDLISQGARKHAKKLIKNKSKLRKKLEEIVKESGDLDLDDIDVLFEEINDFANIRAKIEDFIKRYSKKGESIRLLDISQIIKQLRNVTPQSTKIARAINKNRILKRVLEDDIFQSYYKTTGGKVSPSAFAEGNTMFFKESTSVENYFNEIVHEGTHALDFISGILDDYERLLKETGEIILEGEKMEKYIKGLSSDHIIEFRARIFEREFQLATNQTPDFKSIKELVKFIKKYYTE